MAFKDLRTKRKYENKRYRENPQYFKDNMRKWRIKNREWFMWSSAKNRARRKGIPFNIEISDIEIPEICPVLKIKLNKENSVLKEDSPSLDRKITSLGYVKGNVWVISQKANTMKSNATPEELKLFADWIMNNT